MIFCVHNFPFNIWAYVWLTGKYQITKYTLRTYNIFIKNLLNIVPVSIVAFARDIARVYILKNQGISMQNHIEIGAVVWPWKRQRMTELRLHLQYYIL